MTLRVLQDKHCCICGKQATNVARDYEEWNHPTEQRSNGKPLVMRQASGQPRYGCNEHKQESKVIGASV